LPKLVTAVVIDTPSIDHGASKDIATQQILAGANQGDFRGHR
jgi:kynurenine formamidase